MRNSISELLPCRCGKVPGPAWQTEWFNHGRWNLSCAECLIIDGATPEEAAQRWNEHWREAYQGVPPGCVRLMENQHPAMLEGFVDRLNHACKHESNHECGLFHCTPIGFRAPVDFRY